MIENIQEAKELLKDYNLEEANIPEDIISEIADNNVDIYYSDIYASLNGEMANLVEEARDGGLISDNTSIDKQIQIGQYLANQRILQEAWEELKKELD